MTQPPATGAEPDPRLTQLLDREAIRDALYRYCRGIDRADEHSLRSAYWPDATDRHGAYDGPASGFIDQALPQLQRHAPRSHIIGNILIELHGSQAAVESAFIALQTSQARSGETRETFLCGRYADRFEKRGDQWRIAERVVIYDWIDERPRPELAQAATLFGRRQPQGACAPDDPVYALLAKVRQAAARQP